MDPDEAPARKARGLVIRAVRVTREQVRAARDTLFVFGDNMARAGFGGQAAAMGGEPNSVGVPTKWRPARDPAAYFADTDWQNEEVRQAVLGAFERIERALASGRDVVIPADGLGTGLADLPRRAPVIHACISRMIEELERT